jgi:Mce-associated membrane protein
VTDSKHGREDSVEEGVAKVEDDTDTASDAEIPEAQGRHAAPYASAVTAADDAAVASFAEPERQTDWSRVIAYGVLPALAFLLVIGAGVLKFLDSGVRDSDLARDESLQVAKDSTVALLSYKPDTVEQQLTAARDRLTGEFRDQYTQLTTNVVIPGAKQKQISAVASVPAAASVSANPGHAVALLFVNQTVTVGAGAPTDTASSVRITLDKVGDRWLISKFEPV